MDASQRLIGVSRDRVDVEGAEKFHAVRVPFLSRELLILALVLLVGGSIAALSIETGASAHAAKERLGGHDRLLESVTYSADGSILASCAWDNKIRLWSVADNAPDWGSEIASIPYSFHVYAMALTPDARFLATGGTQGFGIWENRGHAGWENVAEETGIAHRTVAASPDNRTFAVGCEDGTIRFWDVQSLRPATVLRGFSDEVRSVSYSKDGTLLLASAYDGTVKAWRLDPGKAPEVLPIGCGPASSVALNPAGTVIATAYGEGVSSVVSLWNLSSGRRQAQLQGGAFGNNVVAFSPDGRLLACGDKDNIIRLRDPGTGEVVATLDQEMGWVKTLAFSPDGRMIAYGGQDGSIRFRSVPDVAAK